MCNRHRRIFVEQQLHQRAANQIGAADDERVHALQRGMHALGQDDAAERRAWRQRGKAAGEPAGIVRVQPVDILGRIDGVDDGFGVKRFRQRQLDENAVHGRIAVEFSNQRQQIGLRNISRQFMLERRHAGFLGVLVLAADVDLAGGVVADKHDGKARYELMLTLDPRDFPGDAGAKFCRNDFSIDDPGGHFNPSSLDQSGFAAVTFRKASPSILGSPLIATCLSRDVVPDRIFTLALGTPSTFAINSVTARLASPPSAMARTRTLTTERPLASVSIPSISSRPPRGVTRSATLMPSVEYRQGSIKAPSMWGALDQMT